MSLLEELGDSEEGMALNLNFYGAESRGGKVLQEHSCPITSEGLRLLEDYFAAREKTTADLNAILLTLPKAQRFLEGELTLLSGLSDVRPDWQEYSPP